MSNLSKWIILLVVSIAIIAVFLNLPKIDFTGWLEAESYVPPDSLATIQVADTLYPSGLPVPVIQTPEVKDNGVPAPAADNVRRVTVYDTIRVRAEISAGVESDPARELATGDYQEPVPFRRQDLLATPFQIRQPYISGEITSLAYGATAQLRLDLEVNARKVFEDQFAEGVQIQMTKTKWKWFWRGFWIGGFVGAVGTGAFYVLK